ncbi:protein IQ-DOMAIN 14-like [Punica granatum]|uniref:DUF4005 domain-containing protein n=2 Tax=Punica granatum TaxID=22663 RepID=A0A218WXZ9_PUNGR|nr:protein IQ-DOMAIN 14-like [Punica granatum]OWM77755.1 hypothetical protein CDL15_Pgr012457 [Punica granatum]PKI61414.1 hypothetical protein CRG98_018188 [Punica granatum]
MGRAARWFKGLLGMKKEKDPQAGFSSSVCSDKKPEKRRWSIGKSGKDPNAAASNIPANIPRGSDPAWLRSYVAETDEEQSKHAIAVAAATAAAADAAVAAAQAAVAVVRLTSQGRGAMFGGGRCNGSGRERSAAVKIQTVFRGYLARKALRALKGLVKLQALVRGYLVRKRAAATLHSMQALIRAQVAVRSQRVSRYLNKENRFQPENRPGRSIARFDETRSEFHSKRLSASYDPPMNGFDESPKIVEIDTIKPRSRSRRMNNVLVECGEDFAYNGISSPLPYPLPARLSVPESRQLEDYEWYYPVDECRFSTAQSTPRFANSLRSNTPATPAKSACGDSFFRPYSNFPNYMSSTQSFEAKLRSHSAPKQRPEHEPFGPKKRLSLNEIMAARNSISGVRMQRSCSHLHEVLNY